MALLSRDDATAVALARLYDVDLADDPGDLDLYLALAARTGGPILELGAGTGRVAIPLAAADYEVTAVDLDPAMLARLRERALRDGDEASRRIETVVADIVGLDLGDRRFKLAILALNSILLLESRAAQQAAIDVMAAHLEPSGLAVVDVWLPPAAELAAYDGRLSLEYVRSDPETGLTVTKTAAARHEPATGRVSLTAIYEEGDQGAPPRRWIREDRLRLLSADELASMAESAGLAVEVLAGNYELDPMGPYDDRAILVARRRGKRRSVSLV